MTASEPPAKWGADSRVDDTWSAEWKRAGRPQPVARILLIIIIIIIITTTTNNNNNRRLVTLAEHTSDHGKQTNSSTKEKGEHG